MAACAGRRQAVVPPTPVAGAGNRSAVVHAFAAREGAKNAKSKMVSFAFFAASREIGEVLDRRKDE